MYNVCHTYIFLPSLVEARINLFHSATVCCVLNVDWEWWVVDGGFNKYLNAHQVNTVSKIDYQLPISRVTRQPFTSRQPPTAAKMRTEQKTKKKKFHRIKSGERSRSLIKFVFIKCLLYVGNGKRVSGWLCS